MDRGYTDYALFGRWTMAGVFFVTRLKDNAAFTIEAEFATPANRNIRADQIIHLTGVHAQTDCPGPLRRIVVWDADNRKRQAIRSIDSSSEVDYRFRAAQAAGVRSGSF